MNKSRQILKGKPKKSIYLSVHKNERNVHEEAQPSEVKREGENEEAAKKSPKSLINFPGVSGLSLMIAHVRDSKQLSANTKRCDLSFKPGPPQLRKDLNLNLIKCVVC